MRPLRGRRDESGSGAASSVRHGASAWNYADEVSYPFGYGLNYTTFEQTLDGVSYDRDKDEFTAKVTVKNTGDMRVPL